MKKITLAASFILAPVFLQAQSGGQAQAGVTASTSASASVAHPRSNASSSTEVSASASANHEAASSSGERRLSADAQSRVDANLRIAHERKLPQEPIRQRVAEGQAKGASDAQIATASGRTLLDMQGAFDAMIHGGHSAPSDAEVTRGASLIARGYTTVQLEGVARNGGSDRSLTTAFDVLTSLQARGVSNANALAQVQSQLAAHASDAQLAGIATSASGAGNLAGALNGNQGSLAGSASGNATAGIAGSAAAGAGAAAGGALNGAASGANVAGGVSGAVSGVLGKP